MEVSDKVKNIVFYIPGILVLMLFVVYGLGDYWVIGIVADPVEIARYNFGAEAMIAHGGDKYRSASMYAAASLVIGMISVGGLVGSLVLLLKSSKKPLLKAYVSTCLTLLIVIVVVHTW